MFDNLSMPSEARLIDYPILDSRLSFQDYIQRSREIIEKYRVKWLNLSDTFAKHVLAANTPYELYPPHPKRESNGKLKYGVLLVHGLLDSPFSLRDIGNQLQKNGMLCRSILLPGHGTIPSDLVHVSYHDWIQAVRYGVETLRHEVEHIFLIGYSTGAALSVYQAMQDAHIAGLILLSPAIRIKNPVDYIIGWHGLMKHLSRNNTRWIFARKEIDYAKYQSVAFNPVSQVAKLTDVLEELRHHHHLHVPMFMVMSREDETISSAQAINFFSAFQNQYSKVLLYSGTDYPYHDSRILTRNSCYPELNIQNFSHIAIPFAPDNTHYGQHGDCPIASRIDKNAIYGAYSHLAERFYHQFYQFGFLSMPRYELTYNPDFSFMADNIIKFITTTADIKHPRR
jgi:esterase/lipase